MRIRILVILSTAAALCLFLAVLRERTVAMGWDTFQSPLSMFPRMLARSFYDFVLVLIITLFFLAVLYIVRNRPKLQNIISGGYAVVALLLLLSAMVNIPVVQISGQPFDYPLLYYADFLLTPQSHDIIASFFSWNLIAITALTILGLAATSLLLTVALNSAVRKLASPRVLILGVVGAWACYLPFGAWYVVTHHNNYKRLQNPVIFFLTSVSARGVPRLFSMDTPFGPDDVLTVGERRPAPTPSTAQGSTVIKNVIIYVLESVPAEYIETFGGIFPVTPNISKYKLHSLNFTNIYSHSTNSPKSAVSFLCSIYPLLSYEMIVTEYPNIEIPCLSDELNRRGYQTAYFQSADLRFQNYDGFLEDRGFDALNDYRTQRCARPLVVDELMTSSDDDCTVDALARWIEQDVERSFFAVLWTNGTHFPYYSPEPMIDFGLAMKFQTALDPIADRSMRTWRDEVLNRYLNALHRLDQGLGDILRTLERNGLAESTLVVVLGDHGEVFGRHGQFGHGHRLYEENVHVPLIFINPLLFHGDEDPVLGGLTDLPPTIMDLLGFSLPDDWQGRSLFSDDRSPRVYFFTPWSDLLLGYREGDRKFILNATTNEYEVYDLARDPREARNLAGQSPDVREVVQHRLAAWVQYQSRLMRRITSSGRRIADARSGTRMAAEVEADAPDQSPR